MRNYIQEQLNSLFHLIDTTDSDKTIREISSGISMRGYNLWILICSAVLASIGLDTNSTAVIIGAMLISPLMSPILGVGLGLAINDQETLLRSLRNLSIATIASLATSTLYFSISPLSELTSEELARTQPNLLDVMVALFGGVAGIVAGSRTEKTNAIPGVAIATALMPPLCTAGFGLAHGDWRIFGGAFYLFAINAVFISLATFSVAKYLRFPLKEYLNDKTQKRVSSFIYSALVLTLIPSIYFLYTVYKNNREKRVIESHVVNEITKRGNEILKWEIHRELMPRQVKIYYSGQSIEQPQLDDFKKTLLSHDLPDYDLRLFRMNLSREEIAEMSNEALQNLLKSLKINQKNDTLAQINSAVLIEMQALYPQIKKVGIGNMVFIGTKTDTITQVLIQTEKAPIDPSGLIQLNNFLKVRLKRDTLLLRNL
ncbi:TIGR00341 family protein [Runella aurantiaca]|uniref:TIGR00341 family protein n=1 Tax=Runella aurantiaca TaxID=2282308 RepID=A0A369IE73_9BACT|nr:TIGR00341 family protein [Runella aurantiaca]RDB06707.1 TIGR00341 family protein [Runella aurantiaca]